MATDSDDGHSCYIWQLLQCVAEEAQDDGRRAASFFEKFIIE
jgi:hypothetical protein